MIEHNEQKINERPRCRKEIEKLIGDDRIALEEIDGISCPRRCGDIMWYDTQNYKLWRCGNDGICPQAQRMIKEKHNGKKGKTSKAHRKA